MLSLEGCLSGNLPRGAKAPAPVCREFAAEAGRCRSSTGPARSSTRPPARCSTGSTSTARSQQARGRSRARAAARKVAAARGLAPGRPEAARRRRAPGRRREVPQRALELARALRAQQRPGAQQPRLRPAARVRAEPRRRDAEAALRLPVPEPERRPDPGAPAAGHERRRAARGDRAWCARRSRPSRSTSSSATTSSPATPVVAEGVAASITDALGVLLLAVVIVMALTLLLVFRVRRRLLPLALALAAAALTFGAMSVAGASLTIASIAVLPVLVGLAVDYAIQFQSRFNEARSEGSTVRRAERAARAGGPVIATAGAATAAGFLVLLLSPVPMVRGLRRAAGGRHRDRVRASPSRRASRCWASAAAARLAPPVVESLRRRTQRSTAGRVGAAHLADRGPCRASAPRGRSFAASSGPASAGSRRRAPRPRREESGARARLRRCRAAAGPRAADRARAGGGRMGRRHAGRRGLRHHAARARRPARGPRPEDAAALRRDIGRRERDRALGAAARPGRRALDVALPVARPAPARVQRGQALLARRELCPALSLTNLFGSGRQSARQMRAARSTRCRATSRRT